MRAVRINKDQFDNFLFPAIARSSAQSEQELEVAVRILKKIKDPQVTVEDTIHDHDKEMAKARGQGKVYAFHKLDPPEHTFEFEEDEHRLIVERLKDFLKTVSLIAAEEFMDFLASMKDAPKKERPLELQK